MKSITTGVYTANSRLPITTYLNSFETKMLLVIFQIRLFEFDLIRLVPVYTRLKTEIDDDPSEFDDDFCPV